ncbi:MAG: hypothetical protein LBH09_04105, partial [Peptococcaceae bacterium]|nr:hypothetical protein [Peptococcaceae bacterium]
MRKTELAIIGMGFHVGEFTSVKSFLNGLMVSKKAFQADKAESYTAMDTLVEKTITEALQDSGLSNAELKETAFVLHSAANPREKVFLTDGEARQTADRFKLGGAAYMVYDGDSSLFKGLSLAKYLIEESLAKSVCVCVVPPLDSASDEDSSCMYAEGAAALVLKERDSAVAEHNKIYASISAVSIAEQAGLMDGVSDILEDAGVGVGELRIVEVPDSNCSDYAQTIEKLCHEGFGDYLSENHFVVQDTEKWLGRRSALTIAAAFVKHALQLSFFYLFTFQDNVSLGVPQFEELEQSSWDLQGEKRFAMVTCSPESSSLDTGYAVFAVLTECLDTLSENPKHPSSLALLPLACSSPDELQDKLITLQDKIGLPDQQSLNPSLKSIWEDAWQVYRSFEEPAYTVALLFDSLPSLHEEIVALLSAVEGLKDGSGFKPDGRYTSKRGSVFTAAPYGKESKIVYMNPPGTMQNITNFFQLMTMFPKYRSVHLQYLNSNFSRSLGNYNTRFSQYCTEISMIWAANRFAIEVLGMSPDILTGVCLGELSALFSYNSIVFDLFDEYSETTHKFIDSLREVYEYSPGGKFTPTFCIAPLDEIKQAVAKVPGTYLSFVASPRGAFIAGEPDAVKQALNEGNFIYWELADNLYIHTPLVEHFFDSVYNAAFNCNTTIRPELDFEVYSAYYQKPVGGTREDFAEHVANILTKSLDFYGLLEVIYGRGGRVFVDMSTGGACKDWAKEIFEDRDTAIYSIYPPYFEPISHFFKVFANLLSNHVDVKNEVFLNSFYHPFLEESESEKSAQAFLSLDTGSKTSDTPSGEDTQALSTAEAVPVSKPEVPTAEPVETVPEPIASAAEPVEPVSKPGASRLEPVNPIAKPVVLATKPVAPASEPVASAPEPAVPVTESAVSTPEPYIPAAVPQRLPQVSQYIFQGAANNYNAYKMYVEHETLLLGWLQKRYRRRALWSFEQIIEIISGSPSKVWGERYKILDTYKKRARLPMPPFLFVTRVMGVNAEFGKLKTSSSIDLETDITKESIMKFSENIVTYLFLTEMSQVAVLLLSYIGIDIIYGQEIGYRILNTTVTFHSDFPLPGDTVRSRLEIMEISKSGSITL